MNETDNASLYTPQITNENKENTEISPNCAVLTLPEETANTASIPSSPKVPLAVRIMRFVFTVMLPSALALISVSVLLSVAALALGDFDFSLTGIVRLMLGDVVGGHIYITVADESSHLSPSPELQIDETNDTTKNHKDPYLVHTELPTLSNETPYTPDMREILSLPRAIDSMDELYAKYGESAPIVLIIHTHGTESFADTAEYGYRTHDGDRSVIAVGEVIADKLRWRGINTIHCTDIFDSPDFGLAYYNASNTIREYIQKYPSISYVIDVHRDSIELEDGTHYAPTVETSLGSAAQLMFVIGTDHGGSGHTGWTDNLSLAARLHTAIDSAHDGIMRSINIRSASFNEQYTKGSLLVEVGATASTIEEAKLGGEIFANFLADEIIGN